MFAGFFFMIFLTFLFIIIIGGSIIRGIFNLLFGRRGTQRATDYGQRSTDNRQWTTGNRQQTTDNGRQTTTATRGKQREKIFDKSDGEYVDFEEIKE